MESCEIITILIKSFKIHNQVPKFDSIEHTDEIDFNEQLFSQIDTTKAHLKRTDTEFESLRG